MPRQEFGLVGSLQRLREQAVAGHLGAEHGYTRQQAYAICSVAVDLRVSQVVDLPNVLVSAFLPLDLFG